MAKELSYRQTILEKKLDGDRTKHQTSYIPEKFAIIGKVLELKDGETGDWEDGWVVKSVGELRHHSIVEARERDYERTRNASDI